MIAFITWQTITAGLIGLVAGLIIGFYVAAKLIKGEKL